MEPTGRAELEEANARFYRVFETLDLGQMDEIWAHDQTQSFSSVRRTQLKPCKINCNN